MALYVGGIAVTGTQVLDATKLSGNLPALNASAVTTLNASNISSGTLSTSRYVQGGITHADQWRVVADVSGDQVPISNFEHTDSDGFAGIGTAMGYSSSTFTFPVTGIWLITFNVNTNPAGTPSKASCTAGIQTDTGSGLDTSNKIIFQETGTTSFMFDVTNTSNHAVKCFCEFDSQSSILRGNSTQTYSGVTFKRLGNT
tara:strand:+ start:264 stop:863 length:600 start_codon:yes stop_codon:yes gene_type:complete